MHTSNGRFMQGIHSDPLLETLQWQLVVSSTKDSGIRNTHRHIQHLGSSVNFSSPLKHFRQVKLALYGLTGLNV